MNIIAIFAQYTFETYSMKNLILCTGFLLILIFAACDKAPEASFTVSTRTAKVGEAVAFTNTSVNGASYRWDFGDGEISSAESPVHTFKQAGTYNVTFEVTSKKGKKNDMAGAEIVVTGAPAPSIPVPDFTYSPNPAYLGTNITFNDNSTNTPNAWSWDFGDGNSSSAQHPTHVFALGGTYAVTLSASNAAGEQSITKNIIVTNQAAALAGVYDVTDVITGQTFNYTNTFTVSTTVNNRIMTDKFGDYAGGAVYFEINGSNVTLPSQTVNCGIPSANRTFSGSGTRNGNTITLNYVETTNGTSANGTATYVKQ